jgi:competence protein ComEA
MIEGGKRRNVFYFSNHFFHRILLLMCAVAISVPVIYKSRSSRETSAPAAFSVLSSSHGYVRISGDVSHPGVYPFAVNKMTNTAIKMAVPSASSVNGTSQLDATSRLKNGMALNVAVRSDGSVLLTKSQMNTNERLVMGIPLDINIMNEADFDRVPGIGPIMARKIVEYRHNNGGSMAVTDLNFIEGIGGKKYKQLQKYF